MSLLIDSIIQPGWAWQTCCTCNARTLQGHPSVTLMLVVRLCRVRQSQSMQSRTAEPGNAQGWKLPPAEDIEKELYRRANTLEEYTKYSSFNQRFTRIVDSWRQTQVRSTAWMLVASATD